MARRRPLPGTRPELRQAYMASAFFRVSSKGGVVTVHGYRDAIGCARSDNGFKKRINFSSWF
jgi:hypothetical protein